MTITIVETNIIPANKASYTFGAIKEDKRIRNEKDADIIPKTLKSRLYHDDYDEHLLQPGPKGIKLIQQEKRIVIGDGY